MKKIILILFSILLMSVSVLGQSSFQVNGAYKEFEGSKNYTFTGTIDSVGDTLTSGNFDLTSFNSYTAGISLNGGTLATQKVSAYWLGSWDNVTYSVIDTILLSDSSLTLIIQNLNVNGDFAPYNKINIISETGNDSTQFSIGIYGFRK